MSYLSESGPSYKTVSKRSYVAVAAFNANIFSYTVALNPTTLQNVGTLAVLSTATAANCPKGRILRENGRKLYPGANPNITSYMVGVYDGESLLSGFIDPNSPLFAIYSTDKPYYIAARRDPVTGGLVDNSAPVYTNGSVEAGTTITAGTGLTITTGPFVQSRPVTALTDAAQTLTTTQIAGGIITQAPTTARVVLLPSTASIIAALGSVVGASCEFIFSNSTAFASTLTQGDVSTTFGAAGTTSAVTGVTARFVVVVTSASIVVIYRV